MVTEVRESALGMAMTLIAGCALVLFGTAYTPLNTDLGWMLDFGRTAVSLGHLPATNGRSFVDPNHPLVLHEWGACLFFYFVHARWGAAGLIAVRWILTVSVLCVVAATIRRTTASPIARLVAILVAAGALAGAGGLQLVRPQLFSLLLLAATIHLGLYGSRRTLWWCPPLFAVWANLHGGWVAGASALGGICGARGIEQRLGFKPRTVPDGTLIAVPLVSMACLVFNPYGPGLISHTLHHVGDDIRLLNQEWTPLLAGPWTPYATTAVLCLAAAAAFSFAMVNPGNFALLVPLILGVLASLSAIRNVRIAPLLLAPAVTAGLDRIVRLTRIDWRKWMPQVSGLAAAVFLAPLLSGKGMFSFLPYKGPDPGMAIWVMRSAGLNGNLWSDFDWGGTILWALPNVQVGCDGRNVAAYSEDALRPCMLFARSTDPAAVLERYGADMALVPKSYARLNQLAQDYPIIYCDTDACILSRRPADAKKINWLAQPPGLIVSATRLF